MSAAFKNAIAQLDALVQDDTKCYTKANYDAIVNNHIALLPVNEEKIYLVSMCSVGYHSMIYWRDNITKWENFFGYVPTSLNYQKQPMLNVALSLSTLLNDFYFQRKTRGKDIGISDITGIVTGAIGGCAWGAAGGTIALPGAGTVAGCAGVGAISALGGGLGNSAKKAVESFFNWLAS